MLTFILFFFTFTSADIVKVSSFKIASNVLLNKGRFVFSDFGEVGRPLTNAKVKFDISVIPKNYNNTDTLKLYAILAKDNIA